MIIIFLTTAVLQIDFLTHIRDTPFKVSKVRESKQDKKVKGFLAYRLLLLLLSRASNLFLCSSASCLRLDEDVKMMMMMVLLLSCFILGVGAWLLPGELLLDQ